MSVDRVAVWRAHCKRFGLLSSPADLEHEVLVIVQLDGEVEGMRVRQRRLLEQHNALQSWALLDLPLDLGLVVKETSLLSRWTGLAGSGHVDTGDAAFDEAVSVYGDEEARVRALLTPKVREQLLRLHRSGLTFKVADNRVFLHRPQCHDSAEEWASDLRLVVDVARALEEARDEVPVAAELAPYEQAWRDVAVEHSLRLHRCPLSVSGHLRNAQVAAYTERVARRRFDVALRVRFDQPLGPPLEVRSRRAVDAVTDMVQGGAVYTHDARFDHEFHCFGGSAVGKALDEEVRHHLLHLAHDQGHVVLTERELIVRAGNVDAPKELPAMLDTVDEMARHMGSRIALSLRPSGL